MEVPLILPMSVLWQGTGSLGMEKDAVHISSTQAVDVQLYIFLPRPDSMKAAPWPELQEPGVVLRGGVSSQIQSLSESHSNSAAITCWAPPLPHCPHLPESTQTFHSLPHHLSPVSASTWEPTRHAGFRSSRPLLQMQPPSLTPRSVADYQL